MAPPSVGVQSPGTSDVHPDGDHTVTLTDNKTGKQLVMPVLTGTDRAFQRSIFANYYPKPAWSLTIPVLVRPPIAARPLPILMAMKGILQHRGYAIEDLAENSDFTEVCYSVAAWRIADTCAKI